MEPFTNVGTVKYGLLAGMVCKFHGYHAMTI